jgi:hypothetical protein
MDNNYDFEINNNLRGIERNTNKMQETMADKLFLELYGKERYLEYVEKRKFRRQVIWSGVGAFLVGFFGVGLYMCDFSMNVFMQRLSEFFMNLF